MSKIWFYFLILFIAVYYIGSYLFHKEIVTDNQITRKIISRYSNKHPKEVVYEIKYIEKSTDFKEKFTGSPVKKESVKVFYNAKNRITRSEGETPASIRPYEKRYENYPMGDLEWEQNIKRNIKFEFSAGRGFIEQSTEAILNGTVKGYYQDVSIAWGLITKKRLQKFHRTY